MIRRTAAILGLILGLALAGLASPAPASATPAHPTAHPRVASDTRECVANVGGGNVAADLATYPRANPMYGDVLVTVHNNTVRRVYIDRNAIVSMNGVWRLNGGSIPYGGGPLQSWAFNVYLGQATYYLNVHEFHNGIEYRGNCDQVPPS